MVVVRIYKPTKSAMQSGTAKTLHWVLEFKPGVAPFTEPVMGWTGSADTQGQVRLLFATLEAAIDYAKTHDFSYEVEPEHRPKVRPKRYSDNFRPDKIE